MSLEISTFVLGPLSNNTYLVTDQKTGDTAVIDPSLGSQEVLDFVKKRSWTLLHIWLTHAHFDHTAGVKLIASSQIPSIPVSLHRLDLPLYQDSGGARKFGFTIQPGPEPSYYFEDRQILNLGESHLEVRFTPGHTPGHVVFYAPDENVVFCGDVIFRGSIGRTDLPGGSFQQLLNSIQTKILTLPAQTRLLSGHGPETTVAMETSDNPYL
ncbi:MAG TPA: MBL fold metallo-hydrolase [Longilinea sp.]|nr:MBL fold metallo-hydrolase [Longilinea sp.]